MSRFAQAGAVALLVALVAGPLAAAPGAMGAERFIRASGLGAEVPIDEWSGKRVSLADADGDADLDLVLHNKNAHAYVVDVASGRALVEVTTRYPYGPDLGPFNGALVADLEGNGATELIVVNRAAVVSVFDLEPEGEKLRARLRWDRHLDDLHWRPSADSAPILADLDGDGLLEIMTQTEETGTYALRANGSILWAIDHYGGNAEPVVRDVDADGDLDVVVFTDGGVVYAVEGTTGERLWRFDARREGVWPASITSAGAVDDIDGDGRVEVAFCTRNVEDANETYAPGAPSYRQHHFVLFVIRDGKLLWKAKPSWGNPLCSAYLMTHDVDGDGKKEIFGMDWNTIGHKPGNWERLGPSHAFSYTHDGKERWHVSLDAWDAKPPVAMADADGDGRQDVIAYDRGGLVAIDGASGRVLKRVDFGGALVQQGPVIADVRGDGTWRAYVAVTRPDAIVEVSLPSQTVPPAWPGWDRPLASPGVVKPTPPSAAPPPPSAGPTPTATPTLDATPTATPSASSAPPPSSTPDVETRAQIPWPSLALLCLGIAALCARRR